MTDQRHDPAGRLVRQADVGELLAGIAALAKDRDIPTHVHSHISEGSTKAHLEFFHRTQTARLQNAGLLSERCIVMHAGWLNDDDIAAFGSARVRANHNPVGNAMLGFGTVRAGSVLRL